MSYGNLTTPPVLNSFRWIPTTYTMVNTTNSGTYTAGRCMCTPFQVLVPTVVDALAFYINSDATGNVTVGIYSQVTNDTPAGGTLLASSASTALAGTSQGQVLSLSSSVTLAPGTYWAVIELSSALANLSRNSTNFLIPGVVKYFDQAYGALPTTCPAVTNHTAMPTLMVRASV